MAVVRLFANLREMAGSPRLDVEAATVGDALDGLVAQFGDDFATGLTRSRVWINGEPADRADGLQDDDELAIIPPVSGGTVIAQRYSMWDAIVPVATAGVLLFAALALSEAWFASLLVGAIGLWVFDVSEQASVRGRSLPLAPVLAAVVVGALAPYTSVVSDRALEGTGLALVFGVIALLVWAVIVVEDRNLVGVASTLVIMVLAGLATASLVVTRLGEVGAERAAAFIIIVTVSGLVGGLAYRLPGQFLDPYSASALGALAASVFIGWLWDLGVADFFVIGVAMAIAVVAGRGLGSLVRLGNDYGPERAEGWMSFADGAVVAAALFMPIVRAVT